MEPVSTYNDNALRISGDQQGALLGAVGLDEDILQLIQAWPDLPGHIKRTILDILQSTQGWT